MNKVVTIRSRKDRWSDWAVVLVVVAALLLGWGVMALAEGQRESFTDPATGLTVSYPSRWLQRQDDDWAVQVQDPATSGFRTTYQAKTWPISATQPLTSSLSSTLNDAALARAQSGSAFRILDLRQGADIHGRESMEAEYAFVAQGRDPFVQQLPVVVRGLDIALTLGDRAFVFSLLASEDAYARSVAGFRGFVESATLQ